MASFNLLQFINVLEPRMIARAAIYPLRTAIRVVRSSRPDLRGLAFWRAVFQTMQQPRTPDLPPLSNFEFLGTVVGVEVDERQRVIVRAEHGVTRISALAADLFQIWTQPDDTFPEPLSYGVEKSEKDWSPVPVTISQRGEDIEISTESLVVVVARKPCALSIRDVEGRELLRGLRAGRHVSTSQVAWQAILDSQAAFYGLGEKADALNHAGKQFELWNSDPSGYSRGTDPIYMGIPFVMALSDGQAVGLFFDNTYRAWVDLGTATPGELKYRALGGELRLYVMVGSPQTVLERYTELTGRMKLPPLWALGLHQSRWSYYPQTRVLEIAQEFRKRGLPCDVIHLDIHTMDDYRCFTWHPRRFPEPRQMLAALHAQGFKALLMVDPGIQVKRGYRVYDEGIAWRRFITYPDGVPFTGPVWPGDCHFPDFTDPAVREWWGGLYQDLIEDGVDAFWNDMNEIALIVGGTKYPWVPDIVQHSKEGHGADHAEIHNVYGLLMARASCEGLQRLRPDRRPLILTRSGWAGVQRYAMHWTGDNQSTWDHLRLAVQMVLNLGLSGVAMTGPDTGGFTGGPSPELFARWMQVSTFMPLLRIHSMIGSPDQEPWAFGPEVEAISRKYLELRYRLLPYLYTAVWQATQRGAPILRAMSFAYPHDATTYSMDDQYLCGDALLVAPIFEAGTTQRTVYLPQGEWFDFWTGERHLGSQTIKASAPLDTLPLYVRGGAAIPFWPVQQHIGEKSGSELELCMYWASGEHISYLYEDDGICPDYIRPTAHRLSRFDLRVAADGRGGTLKRTIEQGEFSPLYTRVRLQVVGLDTRPSEVVFEGGQVDSQEWDEQTGRLMLEIGASSAFKLRLS